MKSYTDIKQSAQLALLLPANSADMWWTWFSNPLDDVNGGEYEKEPLLHKPVCSPEKTLPCWSLAALFKLLPKCIEGAEPSLIKTFRNDYRIIYDIYGSENITSEDYTNPIDACYEMILKLHEQKIL